MAKPFKSEFDLMAEAYGTINRSKQAVINEHTSARSVIGYPPQIVEEGDKPKMDYGPSGEGKEVHPDEAAETGNGWSDIKSVELGGKVYKIGEDDPNDDGTIIEIEKYRNGYFITAGVYTDPEGEGSYHDDRGNPKEGYGYALTLDGQPMDEADLWDRDTDHDLSTPDSKMQLDDRGNKVHPDEDAENPAHARLDGMVDMELFSQLQKTLAAVVADLHSNDEMFEVGDVLDYLGSTMKGVEY